MKKQNLFILSWDNTGLEACVDITKDRDQSETFEQGKLFDIIRDPDSVLRNEHLAKVNQMVGMMIVRARANPQRHYEIYTVTSDRTVTAKDLRDLFESTPQEAADMIRERGTKLFSDRANKKHILIT